MKPKTPLAYALKQNLVHKKSAEIIAGDPLFIPIPKAAEIHGIDPKRIRGRMLRDRNDIEGRQVDDPLGSLYMDIVQNDWRLAKLARELRQTA